MKRLEALREKMKEENIDFYIVPTGDPHGSEYPAMKYKDRQWLTGFTGSAGTALATMEEGFVWIDGRYFIQGKRQLEGSGFTMKKDGLPETETLTQCLEKLAKPGSRIGFDGKLLMNSVYTSLKDALVDRKVTFVDAPLLDAIWKDRPEIPKAPLFSLDTKYTGLSVEEKLESVREMLWDKGLDMTVISSLDDIAWLTNLRGRDIAENPVFYSFMVVTKREATVYLPKEKQTVELLDTLHSMNIFVREYSQIFDDAKNTRGSRIYVDPAKTCYTLYNALEEGNEIKKGINFTTMLKAVKNPVEIRNQREAYRIDALALVRYFSWLEREGVEKGVKEYDAQQKLTDFRKLNEGYFEDSFTPISAFGPNGAMMHYSADSENSSVIGKRGFYLIDSGGQYPLGTTDITRTLGFGTLTDEEKRDYTLTLKSHITLVDTIFLEGTTGSQLDAVARRPLWKHFLDYKCGTGHGVGYCLNVHEGPHRIARVQNSVALEPGMVVTVEPGVYKEGKYGIRLENVVVVEEAGGSQDGTFYRFSLLSYIPFDRKSIDPSLLTEEEINWVNDYHQKTYELLEKDLNDVDRAWLKEATKAIDRQ